MTRNLWKLMILREQVQFQLYLQNSYHDKARSTHQKIHKMADEFYKEKKFSGFYYKKLKKQLKEYDIMYAGLDIRETTKNWNHRSLIIGKEHFSN